MLYTVHMVREKKPSEAKRSSKRNSNSDARARIIAAARKELVRYGFAGARVDRIARTAGTSKERIYFYFKSKSELIKEVQVEQSLRFQKSVLLDPDNVDEFIGSVFDYYYNNPDDVRIWLWFLLELGDKSLPDDDPRVEIIEARINSVKAAQAAGTIDPNWDPVLLLNLISSMAMSRLLAPVYVHELGTKVTGAARKAALERDRATVIEISHRLITEAPSSSQK